MVRLRRTGGHRVGTPALYRGRGYHDPAPPERLKATVIGRFWQHRALYCDSVASRIIVVLPAYNEAANIASLLRNIFKSLTEDRQGFSIIVVDDGSSDGTARILEEFSREFPLIVERHERNQGLGATLRDGLRRAANAAGDRDIIITMDADESHTPGLMIRMIRMIREGHDVVIASRYQRGSRIYGLSLRRKIVSWMAS